MQQIENSYSTAEEQEFMVHLLENCVKSLRQKLTNIEYQMKLICQDVPLDEETRHEVEVIQKLMAEVEDGVKEMRLQLFNSN